MRADRITTAGFRCGHPFTRDNQVSVGGTRVGCKSCRNLRRWMRAAGHRMDPRSNPERADPDGRLRKF